jgi:hypothetical protein
MNRSLGHILALVFAACFLALQFHAMAETQSEYNNKQIFHIEEVSTSLIDQSIDNRFISALVFHSKQAHLPEQKAKVNQQRQFVWAIEQKAGHAFRQFMQESLAAIFHDQQHKLKTIFNYLQKRELSFEFATFLLPRIMHHHNDESDSNISLN